ncbi:MAG: LolA family protein [Jatrophihabitans sp.]
MSLARKVLQWATPVGSVLVLGVIGAVAVRHHEDRPGPLRAKSAATLVNAVKDSATSGFSGTVVSASSLKLPAVDESSSLTLFSVVGLLAGAHTARVWYSGEHKQRIALVDADGEVDYFRNGSNYWRWDPMHRAAAHVEFPSVAAQDGWTPMPRVLPEQLAAWAVNAIDASTTLSVQTPATVAGRQVYRLEVQPNQTESLISRVQVSIDAQTSTPLGVRVYARGQAAAAINVAFTRITFGAPDDANFAFTPPPGTTATAESSGSTTALTPGGNPQVDEPAQSVPFQAIAHGTGWQRVVEFTGGAITHDAPVIATRQDLSALRPVAGKWGQGRLFASPMVSMLVTEDGRTLVGSVPPQLLYSACGTDR